MQQVPFGNKIVCHVEYTYVQDAGERVVRKVGCTLGSVNGKKKQHRHLNLTLHTVTYYATRIKE